MYVGNDKGYKRVSPNKIAAEFNVALGNTKNSLPTFDEVDQGGGGIAPEDIAYFLMKTVARLNGLDPERVKPEDWAAGKLELTQQMVDAIANALGEKWKLTDYIGFDKGQSRLDYYKVGQAMVKKWDKSVCPGAITDGGYCSGTPTYDGILSEDEAKPIAVNPPRPQWNSGS